MPEWVTVKLIRQNTNREEARDEKYKCPLHRYGHSTFLATLNPEQAKEQNGNDLVVLKFLSPRDCKNQERDLEQAEAPSHGRHIQMQRLATI